MNPLSRVCLDILLLWATLWVGFHWGPIIVFLERMIS